MSSNWQPIDSSYQQNNGTPARVVTMSESSEKADDAGVDSSPHEKMNFFQAVKKVQKLRRLERQQTRHTKSARKDGEHAPLIQDSRDLFRGTEKEDPSKPMEQPTTLEALTEIVLGKGVISWCLACAPLALVSVYFHWGATWVFWLNFMTLIPFASILGDFTEELALHTNETIGGLINASFGNAVEVVVAINALLAGEIRVVQGSLLGSIFSNLLLVLGCCFFFGGLKHKEQKFNATSATANMGLLALSSIALALPTPFAQYYNLHDSEVLLVSRLAAVFLLFMYAQLLVFQLHTHADIFENDGDDAPFTRITMPVALVGLLTTTLLVAFFSDFLVESIDGFTEASGISRTFVGIILLPIVGNAVEHVTAVTVAMKDKMDLAMGIALGSSTQISLLVVPLTVLVGWIVGVDMTLNFPHFEIIMYVLSILTVSIVLANPTCNWLEGSLLITTYFMIAVGFWFEKIKNY
ncbi:Ca2+:H+ antiporter [Fistulifera solaris]|uniref:Ca2+:H+ antiporter n=1 Tax=Fistulifera solaris TaxID=1519565 RepID=A0A1Z5KS18_FISSO|nr:Ca2+:H+ antiporter [Fistulifera solaris]|eukprot:GAX28895.1 Ca2+:H+ antiporter [Fistulifera solaris]